MTKEFIVFEGNDFHQGDIIAHLPDDKLGVCNGLNIEFARYFYSQRNKHSQKGFIKKLKAKALDPTDNFLERIKYYQNHFQVQMEKVIYRNIEDLTKALDKPIYKTSEIIFLSIKEHGEEVEHIVSILVFNFETSTSYAIFDPNVGLSIEYQTKEDLIDAILWPYIDESKDTKIFFTIIDAKLVLQDLGILTKDGNYISKGKYNYKIINDLTNPDKNTDWHKYANTKLDYIHSSLAPIMFKKEEIVPYLIPDNSLQLAILKLDSDTLAHLIEENTMLDLSKTFYPTMLHLSKCKKDSIPVLNALLSKMSNDAIEERAFLEKYIELSQSPYIEDSVELKKLQLLLVEKHLDEINSYVNFRQSLSSLEDVNSSHLCLVKDSFTGEYTIPGLDN